jgi:RimJ/RimL family protein N-acetyltransferase
MITLVSLSPSLAAIVDDEEAFARLTGARLGPMASSVRDVAEQTAAHQARVGGTPEWGGFLAVADVDGAQHVVGVGGYVRPPDENGAVEIAYATFPPYEGRGYGGAIAGALIARAVASGQVRLLCAHTWPEVNASTRILTRHEFSCVGTAHDEDAGVVWRWERRVDTSAVSS